MRKIPVIALLVCTLLVCMVSCNNNDVTGFGTLEITINTDVSKGIESLSMETKAYNVTVSDSQENVIFSSTASSKTHYTASVPVGSCSIIVEALNGNGDVIGRGSASGEIVANKTNSITVTVDELVGNGTFAVSIRGPEGNSLSYTIKDATLTVIRQGNLAYSDGKYSASIQLPNGFYTFSIIWDGADEVIKNDALRIVAGKTVSYNAEFLFLVEGTISILNEIIDTPSIVLSCSSRKLGPEGTLTVSAEISGIENHSCYWMVDGTPVTEYADYSDLELQMENYAEGEHTVSLIVSNGNVIWSEKIGFEIRDNYAERHFVGRRSYSNYWYFFDFAAGEVKYSYYEGSLVEYEPVPYSVMEVDDGLYYIFKESRRTYNYALFVPNDSLDYGSKTLLYYEYGVDENGKSVNRTVGISLEETQSAVVWTDAGYGVYSETYHVKLLESEYVTVWANSLERHLFDEDGVCTVCGYDSNSALYEINDNADFVVEGPGRVDLCRYWPGEFTLSDGTVVNDSSKFYVQKRNNYSNYYTLFYPADIYDTYEEGGGRGTGSSAFYWYLGKYHAGLYSNIRSLYNMTDVHEFVEALMAEGVQETNVEDVPSSTTRTTVYSDCSLIPETIEDKWMLVFYNTNSIQDEEGNPIETLDHFYFTYDEYGNGYVYLYCPEILNEMYERIAGINPDSGNPFWRYRSIYYSDLDTKNRYIMTKTLVEAEFIEPLLEDYINFRH